MAISGCATGELGPDIVAVCTIETEEERKSELAKIEQKGIKKKLVD